MTYKTTTLALTVAAAITGGASAATISWSSTAFVNEGGFKQFMGTDQFDTTGTLLLADNTGGVATTYDGITYTAGAITFAGGSADDTFHEASPNTVSDSGTYGNSVADTVTLGSGGVGPALVEGTQYRIQLFIMDGRSDAGIVGRTVEVDGVNQGTYANGEFNVTYGDGLLVTGTFTADNTGSQSFTVEAFDGTTSKGGQLNALLLHAVPEPSSLALLGLGGLLIARRRRNG